MSFLKLKQTAALLLLLVLLAIDSQTVCAQPRRKITFTEFIKAITSSDTAAYRMSNVDFINPVPSSEIVQNYKSIQLTSDSLIIVNKAVHLYGCRFEKELSLSGFHFNKYFSLHASTWMNQEVYPDEVSIFMIFDNTFSAGLSIHFEKGDDAHPFINLQKNTIRENFDLIGDDAYFQLENNVFDLKAKKRTVESQSSIIKDYSSAQYEKKQEIHFQIFAEGGRFNFDKNVITFHYDESSEYIPSYAGHFYLNTSAVSLTHNEFKSSVNHNDSLWTSAYSLQLIVQEKARIFEFSHNTVQPDLFLQLGYDLNSLRFHNNNLKRVAFDPFKIPDQSNVLLWSDLANATVGLATSDYGITQSYYVANSNQIPDKLSFKELLKFYKKFYDEYKSAGDIQSANQVYIKIKDLETRELRNSYQTDPSFNLWFRVKLNQLLKHYTAYGTDPAQALVASFWVVFVFAVFYFFFPSTWDLSSKSTLIRDFKDFIEKNEKGYVKPFFKMSKGFVLSLLNAITLSLNAFVTLGFGEIPTKGVAKYITVVEGFLGWFLLSIFTVSLVSQLLF